MKSFWSFFGNYICGWVGVLLLFAVQFLWWLFSPTKQVSIWIVFLLVTISFLICAAICAKMRVEYRPKSIKTPIKVLQYSIVQGQVVLLISPTSMLAYGMIVTICLKPESDFADQIIGVGVVECQRDDGKFQVKVFQLFLDNPTLTEFCLHSVRVRELIVKPFITKDNIDV